jgi:hypothetical protein
MWEDEMRKREEADKKEERGENVKGGRMWQPAQENIVLPPKPIHFGH